MSYMSSIFHDGKWWSDLPGACFATREEAESFNIDIRHNSTLITDSRVVETDAPVNAEYKDQKLRMEGEAKPEPLAGISTTKH